MALPIITAPNTLINALAGSTSGHTQLNVISNNRTTRKAEVNLNKQQHINRTANTNQKLKDNPRIRPDLKSKGIPRNYQEDSKNGALTASQTKKNGYGP